MEFHFDCKECGHGESWDSELSCKLAAAWHLHDMHREEWDATVAATHPGLVFDRPELYGSRYEDWESQV